MGVSQQESSHVGRSVDSLDDAEKGMYDSATDLVKVPSPPSSCVYLSQERTLHYNSPSWDARHSPLSPVHEGITPNPSLPELSLAFPKGRRASVVAAELKTIVTKPEPVAPKMSRWLLANLWFNTYRKFFTLIVLLNLAGIIVAITGHFPYAESHMGALVLGNLLMAIMMRNELCFRILYIVAIYGLRSVSIHHCCQAEDIY